MLKCSFGMAPAALLALPTHRVFAEGVPAATVMDHKPVVNVPSFGACTSLTNPTVASATAAASGVLTPMPCVPATPAPWVPGSPTVTMGGFPALNPASTCSCAWGGIISVAMPGTVTIQVA
jgi:hypothetical protein